MPKNYMEILVDDVLGEVIKAYDICNCDHCLADIKSLSLNSLPPMYFLSHIGPGEKKAFLLDRQRRITVLAKIAESIDIVNKRNVHYKSEGAL